MSKNNKDLSSFDSLSLKELKRGVELLVSPSELCEREVLVSILKALEFEPQDVRSQIKSGAPLNAGPILSLNF